MLKNLYRPYEQFSLSKFVIERKYERIKLLGDDFNKIPKGQAEKEMNESPNLFDNVISSLRLLKKCGVYRDNIINTQQLTFHPYGGIHQRFPFRENITIGEKCIIKTSDIIPFKNIFIKIGRENDSRFKISLGRLHSGVERAQLQDSLLDYCVGLESLYLPDGNSELTFRVALRIAIMLGEDEDKQEVVFDSIYSIYSKRGKIVHGNLDALTKEEVEKMENFLRESLKLWLKNKELFSTSNLKKMLFHTKGSNK